MAKKREKINYLNFTFTIFEKYQMWQLSFKNPETSKVVKRSTKLISTTSNLIIVKKEIIPSIVEFFTGKIETIVEDKEYTLDDFAVEYFVLYKSKVRHNTYQRNLQHYLNHIKPYFANRLISSIKPMELENWQNDFKKSNYKPLTIQKYRSVLYSIFDEAVKNSIININPLSKINAPKRDKQFIIKEENKDDMFPFSNNEIKKILENSSGYLKNFILFMYATGIRPGEIIALEWSDINFDKKEIRITKTKVHGFINLPKTQSSYRLVDMLPLAQKALINQFEITKDHKHIFLTQYSKPFYSHDIINLRFKNILIENNIQVRSLYNLRHTFASQLISSGEDIVWVSKMLGHIDVSITLKYYTKFIKEDEEARFKKISKIGANFGANIL